MPRQAGGAATAVGGRAGRAAVLTAASPLDPLGLRLIAGQRASWPVATRLPCTSPAMQCSLGGRHACRCTPRLGAAVSGHDAELCRGAIAAVQEQVALQVGRLTYYLTVNIDGCVRLRHRAC
jgi:hypothetical protein